jgi:hypothetical protein
LVELFLIDQLAAVSAIDLGAQFGDVVFISVFIFARRAISRFRGSSRSAN